MFELIPKEWISGLIKIFLIPWESNVRNLYLRWLLVKSRTACLINVKTIIINKDI